MGLKPEFIETVRTEAIKQLPKFSFKSQIIMAIQALSAAVFILIVCNVTISSQDDARAERLISLNKTQAEKITMLESEIKEINKRYNYLRERITHVDNEQHNRKTRVGKIDVIADRVKAVEAKLSLYVPPEKGRT